MTIPKRFKDKREQRNKNGKPDKEDINDDPWENYEYRPAKKQPPRKDFRTNNSTGYRPKSFR